MDDVMKTGTSSKSLTCKIGPSILSGDLSRLSEECQKMMEAGADYLHLDVMDGHFVPNLTFGHPMVKCLRPKLPDVFFDMHMMVAKPEQWVEEMASSGASQYTFHVEATDDPAGCIRKIKEAGMLAGIGVKPGTSIDVIEPFVEDVDMVLVMTVEPGFGGQAFMADMMPKVEYLRRKYRFLDIEVDGGVTGRNIHVCAEAGANMIVSGTAVIKSDTPREVMTHMRRTVNDVIQRPPVER